MDMRRVEKNILLYLGVGVVALVHDNRELPRIHVAGLEFASGFRHRLLYSKKISQRLPPPHSDCSDTIPPSMQAMFSHYQGADYEYSIPICLMICLQEHK